MVEIKPASPSPSPSPKSGGSGSSGSPSPKSGSARKRSPAKISAGRRRSSPRSASASASASARRPRINGRKRNYLPIVGGIHWKKLVFGMAFALGTPGAQAGVFGWGNKKKANNAYREQMKAGAAAGDPRANAFNKNAEAQAQDMSVSMVNNLYDAGMETGENFTSYSVTLSTPEPSEQLQQALVIAESESAKLLKEARHFACNPPDLNREYLKTLEKNECVNRQLYLREMTTAHSNGKLYLPAPGNSDRNERGCRFPEQRGMVNRKFYAQLCKEADGEVIMAHLANMEAIKTAESQVFALQEDVIRQRLAAAKKMDEISESENNRQSELKARKKNREEKSSQKNENRAGRAEARVSQERQRKANANVNAKRVAAEQRVREEQIRAAEALGGANAAAELYRAKGQRGYVAQSFAYMGGMIESVAGSGLGAAGGAIGQGVSRFADRSGITRGLSAVGRSLGTTIGKFTAVVTSVLLAYAIGLQRMGMASGRVMKWVIKSIMYVGRMAGEAGAGVLAVGRTTVMTPVKAVGGFFKLLWRAGGLPMRKIGNIRRTRVGQRAVTVAATAAAAGAAVAAANAPMPSLYNLQMSGQMPLGFGGPRYRGGRSAYVTQR